MLVTVQAMALAPGDTVLVNRAPNGTHPSFGADSDVSSDGRCVVFASSAAAFPGSNGQQQVYVRDTAANTTTLVSVTPGGAGGDASSQVPDVTPDCRYVAFESLATNLTGATLNERLVYRRDLQTATTILVSRADGAAGAPPNEAAFGTTVSDDGNRVAFRSGATNVTADDTDDDGPIHNDLFVREIGSGDTTLVDNEAGEGMDGFRGAGSDQSLSGDGTLLAFATDAANISTDDASDASQDVFVKNLATGAVTYVSRASGANGEAGNSGSGGAQISGDGSRVAFVSAATNLRGPPGPSAPLIIQVFVRDLTTNQTILTSRDAAGNQADADSGFEAAEISADGTRVVFSSPASNLPGGGGDGGALDVFLHDVSTATTEVAARRSDGTQAGSSLFSAISGDGDHVAFTTPDGMVADDTDGQSDLYLHRFVPGAGPTPTPTATPTATVAPTPTPTPPAVVRPATIRGDVAFVQGTANDLYLACTRLDLYLVDVLPAGRRVSVTGAADLRLVGQTLDILLDTKKVGTAVVNPDGSFAAKVRAPSRRRRARARYQAKVGGAESQKLRLARRMVATTLTRSGSNLVLRGIVNPPRARKQPAIQVERFLSCRRREKVKIPKVRPGRSGRFSVRIKVPAGPEAVLYRARTKVPARPGRPATKGTFTLPRAADLG